MGVQIPKLPPKRLVDREPRGRVVRLPSPQSGARAQAYEPGLFDSRRNRSIMVACLCALAFIGWDTLLLLPIRLLVVTFHELGHAAAAVMTGGEVLALGVGLDESGVTVTRGGSRFSVLNGGYLGSIAVGLLLLLSARNVTHARMLAGVLGAILAIVSVRHFPVEPVGLSVVLLPAVGLMGLATRSPGWLAELVTRTLGWFSLLYSLFDIREDVFGAGGLDPRSDAAVLEAMTGIAAPIWGISWVVIGVGLLWGLRRRLK